MLRIRRLASAPMDSSIDRTRVRTLFFAINANEWYICTRTPNVHRPALSRLPQRSDFDFASVHQLLRDCADEAPVDSEAETKVLILCIVSIERRRLAQAFQVLDQLGIKRPSQSKLCGVFVDLRFQRTSSATMNEYTPVR